MAKFKPYNQIKPFTGEFRGIQFHIETETSETGQRLALFELPFKEEFEEQHLGRARRKWKVSAFLIGHDQEDKLEKLQAACEANMAGVLTLPTNIYTMAECKVFIKKVQANKIGQIDLDFEFVECSKPAPPKVTIKPNLLDFIKSKLSAIKKFIKDLKDFADAVMDYVHKINGIIDEVIGIVRAALDVIGAVAQVVCDAVNVLKRVKNLINAIKNSPERIAKLLSGAISAINSVLSGKAFEDKDGVLDGIIPSKTMLNNKVKSNVSPSKVDNNFKAAIKKLDIQAEPKPQTELEATRRVSKLKELQEEKDIDKLKEFNKANKSDTHLAKEKTAQHLKTVTLIDACIYATEATFETKKSANDYQKFLVKSIDTEIKRLEIELNQNINIERKIKIIDPKADGIDNIEILELIDNLKNVRFNILLPFDVISSNENEAQYFKVNKEDNLINVIFNQTKSIENIDKILELNQISNLFNIEKNKILELS
jgi:prophage DNA circulation protein